MLSKNYTLDLREACLQEPALLLIVILIFASSEEKEIKSNSLYKQNIFPFYKDISKIVSNIFFTSTYIYANVSPALEL